MIKRYFAKSDQGPYQSVNEDAVGISLENNLFFVVDAFGGSSVGDKMAKNMKVDLPKYYLNFAGDPDGTFPFFYSTDYLIETNALINSLHLIHKKTVEENQFKEMNERAGASCVAASFNKNICSLVTTGNCSALLLRENKVIGLSAPMVFNPLGEKDLKMGRQSFPTQAIGLFQELGLNVFELSLVQDDLILLLSDGVYSFLSARDIELSLKREVSWQEKMSSLLDLANIRGNKDNQSLLSIQL